MPHFIYADFESLIRKIDGCENNPEYSSTTKIGQHIPFGYSMSTICGFDHLQNKHTLYHGKDCRKRFCDCLEEHAKHIIDFKKKRCYLWQQQEKKKN